MFHSIDVGRRRSRLLAALTVASGAFLLGMLTPAWAGGAAEHPIRVGLSAPLTGQFAQDGRWFRQGVELAVKDINAAGGIDGRPIRLFAEDDQGPNPTAAENAVTKLLTEDHVVAVLGPHFTPAMLPSEALFAHYHVPALTGASGPVVTQQHNKWIFRVRLDDATGAQLLVKYVLNDLKWRRIGLDYVNTAFGQSGIAEVKKALAAHGIKPVITETHLDSTKDFTSQLLALKRAHIQGVIVWTDDQPGGLIAKQMKTLGVGFGLAGSTTFSQPPFLQLAGSAANGAVAITDFVPDNPDPVVQAWERKYAAVYHAKPELYASTYYDAMNILAAAMRHAPELTGSAIEQALMKIANHHGVMTTYTWSANGDMVHSGFITKVEDGKPVIIERVK